MGRYPPRELAGVLLALNCALVLPLCVTGVGEWHGEAHVLALHGASVLMLLASTACVFGLMTHGSATSVALGQAVSPLPALLLAGVLLAIPVGPVRVVAACVVTVALVTPLRRAFGRIPRAWAVGLVLAGAVSAAMVAVLTKLLLEEGVGLLEIYVVRTGGAAVLALAVFPPRSIPLRSLPGLSVRAAAITVFYLLSIAALDRGDPATVQATVATTPLMLAVVAAVRSRRLPERALAVALVAAPLSIAVLAST